MSWAALLLLVLCLAAAGLGVLCSLRVPVSLSLALATGAVALHAVLQIETLVGVRWSFLESFVLGALGVVALWRDYLVPRFVRRARCENRGQASAFSRRLFPEVRLPPSHRAVMPLLLGRRLQTSVNPA